MRGGYGAIVLLAVLSHANSLPGAFHYDDAHSIVDNPSVRSFDNWLRLSYDPTLFSSERGMAMYRPLVVFSYMLNYAMGGYEAAGYIAFNLLIHALASLSVLLFLQRWINAPQGAWCAAAIFAVHPINAQVVNYASARSESMATLGVLCALWLARERKWIAAWLSYAGALLAKSQALVLLPLLWVVDRGLRAGRHLIPFAMIAVLYIAVIYANAFLPSSLAQDVRPYAAHLYTQAKALIYYIFLFVMPHRLSVEHPFIEVVEPGLATGLAFIALCSALFFALRSTSYLSRGTLFWLAAMSLTSLVPLNVLVNEHRLYLGGIGLCAIAVGGATQWGRPWRYGAGIYLALLALLTWQRNEVWRDELTLWSDAAAKAPQAFRAQSNLGLALLNDEQWQAAQTVLEGALQLNPHYARTWSNLGLVYEEMGAYDRADSSYRRAMALRPDWTGFRIQLGRLYLGMGRYGEVIDLLQGTEQQDLHSAEALALMGLAHQRAGRVQEAVSQYNKSIELYDLSGEVFNNLGLAYQSLGEDEAARTAFARALNRAPDAVEFQINLRQLELRLEGQPEIVRYVQLVEEFPQQVALWRALASELAQVGRLEEAIRACKKVLELAPQDGRVRENLRRLELRLTGRSN